MRRWLSPNYIFPVMFFIAAVLSWELLPAVFGIRNYVFPRLSSVLEALFDVRGQAVSHLGVTLLEASVGLFFGSLIGFGAGIVMAVSSPLRRSILPFVVASNAIPVVAIAPIVVLWCGHGTMSKSVVAAFLCFFPLSINTFRGLTTYDKLYEDLFSVLGANEFEFLMKFKLPNASPFIFSGLKLNATYSVIGAVVAEFVGSDSGLGFGMLQATYSLNTPRLYAYMLLACGLGLTMYGTVFLVEKLVPFGQVERSGQL